MLLLGVVGLLKVRELLLLSDNALTPQRKGMRADSLVFLGTEADHWRKGRLLTPWYALVERCFP